MPVPNDSIEASTYPLVFAAQNSTLDLEPLDSEHNLAWIRTRVRPLAGMQKEALVQFGPTGTAWRIVCDEGPWLNGTDLAPFPLAFFTSGLAASFMSAFLAEAAHRDIRVDSARLELNNFFTMEGSALRGTMSASAQPVQVKLTANGSASASDYEEIVTAALRDRCPAERCLESALSSGFAVYANREQIPWPGSAATGLAGISDPGTVFERLVPAAAQSSAIIRKTDRLLRTDPSTQDNAGAVGLKPEQKRRVHVLTECRLRDDGLKAIKVQCIQPAGSCFELLSDDSRAAGGLERAPDGLAYLSAGIAFCFMTQIGRYAQISKQGLEAYRIVQDTGFRLAGEGAPGAQAVQTAVFLDTREAHEKSLQLVRMGEQTCYIHAACRTPLKTELSFLPRK